MLKTVAARNPGAAFCAFDEAFLHVARELFCRLRLLAVRALHSSVAASPQMQLTLANDKASSTAKLAVGAGYG